MRRLLLLILYASSCFAAGTVQQSISPLGNDSQGRPLGYVLSFSWTGDSMSGSVPATAGQGLNCCAGFYVVQAEFIPGSPSPTAGYSAVIQDPSGVDVLGGAASSLSATLPQSFSAATNTPPLQGALTLVISGQLVASAKGTVYVFIMRPGSVSSAALFKLQLNQAGGGGGGGTPGGTNGQPQYNNNGAFGGFTMSGDASLSVPNLTLATVNSSPGSCGDSSHVCQVTTNGKGLITSQSAVAISGGAGNSGTVVTLSFSATPTFTCPSATAGTIVTFMATSNAPIVLTGNITSSTLASCTPGGMLEFVFKQDATGGRTVVMPTNFDIPLVHPAPNATTKLLYKYDGVNGRLDSAVSDAGFSAIAEISTPGVSPPSSVEYLWSDSTRNTATLSNASGAIHIMPRTGGSNDQLSAGDLSTGALANGITATTQSADDNSTKVATTAYVDRLKFHGISFSIGDPQNSSGLTTSNVAYLASVPFACTIAAYNLAIDAGTITVKFWKIATGTAIPTSSNSISTSGVSISSGTAIHSTTLTDFTTTTVNANDIMAMAVTAVATAKFVSGVLECDQ